ncbi:DUF1194 domain-containing protein [Silicimonas algicola]|uniref:Uncharacterized protein DUF1194 n=1 Tax=Silicimonas algicola TaxID=1826607 RepID=A0A316FVH1_9RHOB|nr:DUF1194 domain-containing protein [Silicimonas algicola]PWK51676.1 uncharacterized protein DUF1194 [Silicimonas algicola]
MQLVLLADATGSISEPEIRFQREGYAAALTNSLVLSAIDATATGSIALIYVEWAEGTEVIVDWTKIDGPDSAANFAEALLSSPRRASGRNAIGTALLAGKSLIEGNEFSSIRAVIDFSGDSSVSYAGPPLKSARAEVLGAGITINGLPINCYFCDALHDFPEIEAEYEELIIGGPGAFVLAASNEDDLVETIRRKLILEISGNVPISSIAQR